MILNLETHIPTLSIKTLMNAIKSIVVLIGILIFVGCSATQTQEANREIRFNVAGMYCDGCVKAIDQRLNKLDGASNVSVTLQDSLVIATFPESKIPSDQELSKMLDEMGYTLVNKEIIQ